MQEIFHRSRDQDIASVHFMKWQQNMENCYTFAQKIKGKIIGMPSKSASQSPVQSNKN